ncbi:hypothetical protein ACHWQZ_G016931 [Mnemiopsis leidyi]
MRALFGTLLACCGDPGTHAPIEVVRTASVNADPTKKADNPNRKMLKTAQSRQFIQREQSKMAKQQSVSNFQAKSTNRSYDKPIDYKPSLRSRKAPPIVEPVAE